MFAPRSFQSQPYNATYLSLLKEFAPDKCATVIGFRLQSHRKGSGLPGVEAADQGPTPEALGVVAAQLIANGVFTVDTIYGHMGPPDESVAAAQKVRTRRDTPARACPPCPRAPGPLSSVLRSS